MTTLSLLGKRASSEPAFYAPTDVRQASLFCHLPEEVLESITELGSFRVMIQIASTCHLLRQRIFNSLDRIFQKMQQEGYGKKVTASNVNNPWRVFYERLLSIGVPIPPLTTFLHSPHILATVRSSYLQHRDHLRTSTQKNEASRKLWSKLTENFQPSSIASSNTALLPKSRSLASQRYWMATTAHSVQYLTLSCLSLWHVPEEILLLSGLRSLNLSGNQLTVVPQFLERMQSLSGFLILYDNPIREIKANLALLPLRALNLNGRNIIMDPSKVENLQEVMRQHLKDTSSPPLKGVHDPYYFYDGLNDFKTQLTRSPALAQSSFDATRGIGKGCSSLYANYLFEATHPPQNPFLHPTIEEAEHIHTESVHKRLWRASVTIHYCKFLQRHNAWEKIIEGIDSIKTKYWVNDLPICALYLKALHQIGIHNPNYFAQQSALAKARPICTTWFSVNSVSVNSCLWEYWHSIAWNEAAYSEICQTFDRLSNRYFIEVPLCALYLRACGHDSDKTLPKIEKFYNKRRMSIPLHQVTQLEQLDEAFEYAKNLKTP